jgi:hypothetical protein
MRYASSDAVAVLIMGVARILLLLLFFFILNSSLAIKEMLLKIGK